MLPAKSRSRRQIIFGRFRAAHGWQVMIKNDGSWQRFRLACDYAPQSSLRNIAASHRS